MQSEKISQTIPDWAQFSQGHGKKIKAKNILITLTWNLKMLLSVHAPTSQANINGIFVSGSEGCEVYDP